MRKKFEVCFLLIVLLSLASGNSFAVNYYVSNAGNDSNSGTSSAEPWQTIDQLNTVSLLPGDSVFFLSGNIFRGQINVLSGGNVNAVIYFGTYGGTDPATISGATPITNWSVFSGTVYKTSFTEVPAHLFANNQQMTIARYPNSGFLFHQEGIGNAGFVDTSLSQPNGYWNGATVRMRTSTRLWEFQPVNLFSEDTVLFSGQTANAISAGYGYYLDNLLSELDTANEWYFDAALQVLYFNAPGNQDPNQLPIEASVNSYGMLIQNGSGYLDINNLNFVKQMKAGIFTDGASSNIKVRHCGFSFQNQSGINSENGCSSCLFDENTFNDINGAGILLNNSLASEISHNDLRRIGLISGYGINDDEGLMAIYCNGSDSISITENVVDSIGSCGIFMAIANSMISKNNVTNCLLHTNDLGGMFLYGNGESSCTLQDNIVLHTIGSTEAIYPVPAGITAGIYADANATGNIFYHNTIAFSTTGLHFSGGAANNAITNNLVYGCTVSQLDMEEGASQGITSVNEVTGNTFYALSENSDVVKLSSAFETFDPATWNSNYYFNPYDFFAFHFILNSFDYYFTLNQWKNETANDAVSKSAYVLWHRFNPIDSLGTNQISNGDFTNNFDGWSSSVAGNIEMLLDNSTPLDGGCLKLVKNTGYFVNGSVFTADIAVDSATYYLASLSNYSIKDGNVRIFLSMFNPPFLSLGLNHSFPFSETRNDYWTIFQSPKSSDKSRFEIFIYYKDSIVWVDNFSLIPVTVSYEAPTAKSRFFVNPTGALLTFNLGDSLFFDLNHDPVFTQLDLNPYSSAVLLFDSSLISGLSPLISHKGFHLFPNPASAGTRVLLKFDDPEIHDITIKLLSISGNIISKQTFSSSSSCVLNLPGNILPGMYLVQINTAGNVYESKLVVIH